MEGALFSVQLSDYKVDKDSSKYRMMQRKFINGQVTKVGKSYTYQ